MLIQVSRQTAHRWVVLVNVPNGRLGCHYFLSGQLFPSQLQNITVLWVSINSAFHPLGVNK